MKRFKDRRKVISLTVVGIAYALIVLPLIITNVQKQQDLRSKADQAMVTELSSNATNQSSQSQCTSTGNAEVGLAYTNTDTGRAVVVSAVDSSSGQTVNLGRIEPQETKTGVITPNTSTLNGGTITYTVAFADTPSQTSQKTATYATKTCTPANTSSSSKLAQVAAAAAATCGNVTTDIILIIDRSGSMGQNNKLVEAKNAAKNFIDVVSKQESSTRIGLVSFSTTSTLSNTLTTDITSLNSKIDALTASGNTCHECGVKAANLEVASHGRSGVKKVILLLTDGEANFIEGGTQQVSAAIAAQKALDAVKAGFAQSNTVYFSIGFDVKTTDAPVFLTNVASLTGGKYYFPAPSELDSVYQEISQLIGKGLLGGYVFNDANLNGTYDSGEGKLSGWTINATYAGGTKSATTDTNGTYTIAGLCDGSYTLAPVAKTGWTQTMPANSAPYSIAISNASQYTDKNFGVTDKARCNDGIDNDNNGFKDIDDSTCHSDGNPKNPGSYIPTKDGERGGGNTCADSKDNNGDGLIDGADPVCHTDGNPQNPNSYDPSLPEVATTTSMVCSPSTTSIINPGTPLTVTLKNSSGTPLTGKTVTWTSSNSNVTVSPTTAQTNASGSATATASVPTNYASALTSTITAKFAGASTNAAASCTVQANYSPDKTSMLLTVLLDGIGNRGDNTNPDSSSLSNKNPKHPTIGADIQIFTLDNQLIGAGTGSITYDTASGSYKGNVPIQIGFPTGKYQIKIKADTYLRRLVTGIQSINAGQQNTVTNVALVAGDANNDNQLNILDYNMVLDCYSDLSAAANCSASDKQVKADLNDDALVNQIDYNLFLREISTQPGQ